MKSSDFPAVTTTHKNDTILEVLFGYKTIVTDFGRGIICPQCGVHCTKHCMCKHIAYRPNYDTNLLK